MKAIAAALVLAVAAGAVAGRAAAEVKSPSDITAELEASRGVKVLKLQETTVDGQPAYIVTIMNPATESNAAFQVERILVDAQTASPIRTYRHGPTGWSDGAGPQFGPPHEGDGPTMRRMTFGTP